MPISDDWDFDYPNKVLQHVDGILSYDGGTAGQAAVGQYIRGTTSGAIGKVIAVTGNAASGTYTLTNVQGLFQDNEPIALLSEVGFDAVTAGNGGFRVGDTLVDQVTGSIVVRAIEYNRDGTGAGTIFGDSYTAWTDGSQIDISGGQADVCDSDSATTSNDNDAVIDTALVNGTLAVPGTANTNDSCIVNYDGGTVAIPEQAILEDATSGARGLVEQVYGSTVTGSIRVVDYDSTGGSWGNDNILRVDQVIGYNNQVAGEVFSVGDVVVGGTSGATGRVLADTGTQLILADESGTWTNTEDLNVGGTKIAEANGTNDTLNVAVVNGAVRTEQRPTAVGGGSGQGGIYASGDSLNIVRKFNSLYTLSQDTFDELLQMDDDEALDAAVKGGAYSLVFDWLMEGNTEVNSVRFLRQGGLVDTNGAEVWANPQTVGAQNKITDTAFLYDVSQPYRQPQLYVEQDGEERDAWWLEGQVDVLLKVRTRQDPRYIAPATPGLGQLIPGGDPSFGGGYAVFNREFHVSTYDATEVNGASGGVNTVALGTGSDNAADRNPNGTHSLSWNTGSAATFVVGEEFYTAAGNSQKVGIVVAQTGDAGATGTLEYVLKSGTQFANTDSITGSVSGKTAAVNGAPTNVVAGYGADIRFSVIDITATPSGGTGITGTFIPGEGVTQAVTGATGFFVAVDEGGTNTIAIEVATGTFSGDNDITGDTSGASWDAGTGATYPSGVTFDQDLNNGDGAQPYAGSVSGDRTGASPETMQNVYQYSKFLARHEEDTLSIAGPGTAGVDADATVGKLFRRLKNAYAEVKPGNPFGVYTGSMAFAQGWFLDTAYINAADIRDFSVIDDEGTPRNPPNLQSLTISGIDTGWRVAAYRSTGVGLTTILRNEFQIGPVGTNNQAADSIVEVQAGGVRGVSPLPADVPDSGVLRILSPNNTGNYIRMTYSSVDRTLNQFTLTGTIGSFLTAAGETSTDLVQGDNAHVVFIEQQAAGTSVTNTMQYVADIPIVFKARLKGYKPFRSTTNFTSTGGSGGVVQNVDTIVDLP